MKLVKPDQFVQDVPHALTILSPIAPDDLLCHVTILVNKHTSAVELSAVPATMLHKESVLLDLLRLAAERIKEIHRGRTNSEIILPS